MYRCSIISIFGEIEIEIETEIEMETEQAGQGRLD